MTVSFTPLTPHVGAEVIGMSAGDFVTRSAADRCSDELARYGVLVFRDANLSDEDLIAFSRLLGQVVVQPTGEHKYPEIQTITLDPSKTNPLLAAYRRGNFLWHFDGAADPYPQRATLLSAQEIDASGGDTEFANAYAAYAALPGDEKSAIANLRVVHSVAAALRRANPDASDEERTSWKHLPTRIHPLVWTHRDGRKSLLVGATAAEVVDWPAAEGTELLARLLDRSTQPEFVMRHRWRCGDLVIWDNTGMLHRALPFERKSRRLLHRTTLVGQEAVTSTTPLA